MLGQSARKGVAESTNPTQPSINRDEVAQFTNAGALLLRIIIIVSCIMFMLRSLSITPAIIITIVPAIATVRLETQSHAAHLMREGRSIRWQDGAEAIGSSTRRLVRLLTK
jgi:hypothetical protein